MVDTAEERAAEAVVVRAVVPHRATATGAVHRTPLAVLFSDEGGADGGSYEGQDWQFAVLPGAATGGGLAVVHVAHRGRDAVDRFKTEHLTQGVGGIEGLGAHGLAPVATVGVVLDRGGGDDGNHLDGPARDMSYIVAVRGGMSVSDAGGDLCDDDPNGARSDFGWRDRCWRVGKGCFDEDWGQEGEGKTHRDLRRGRQRNTVRRDA